MKEKWQEEGYSELLNYFEDVYSVNYGHDFIEMVGSMGGEPRCRRYYKDGTIRAK